MYTQFMICVTVQGLCHNYLRLFFCRHPYLNGMARKDAILGTWMEVAPNSNRQFANCENPQHS